MRIDPIIEAIQKSKKIGLTFHISPDGDSIGSALAFSKGLKMLGKDVYIICKEKAPEIYRYLFGIEEINGHQTEINKDTECLIVLDCGDPDRISANMTKQNRNYTLINIDHHQSNSFFGDINYVNPKSSAVGEIIYQLLIALNIPLDEEIAKCLYTSLICDSGGFKYSNTTSETLLIASELIKLNFDFSKIYKIIFENKRYERVKLYGRVIEGMYLSKDTKICIMQLNKEMNLNHGYDFGDTSDIISIGMEIDSVEVCILFKETEDGVKVSLRSKSKVDVSSIAQNFGGGGHIRAAGLTMYNSLEESINIMTDLVKTKL